MSAEQDIELPNDVQPGAAGDVGAPGPVLVTGATGFFGAALVHELLDDPSAEVWCLVRPDGGTAAERLRERLEFYGIWRDDWAPRLRAVPGELGKPGCGLSTEDYKDITGNVARIYHSAAHVNLSFPYESVRGANVTGTVDILRLACEGRAKRVCHVSTVSVLDISSHVDGVLADPAPLASVEGMRTGYARSKWVAEHLVAAAAERGIDVRTVRLGALAGSARTGVSNPNDYVWLMLGACLALQQAPLLRAPTSWLPVDYVARATIALTELPTGDHRPYQVLPEHEITYPMLFSWLRRMGCTLRSVDFTRWRQRIVEAAVATAPRQVRALASALPDGGLPGERQPTISSARTQGLLREAQLPPPVLDEQLCAKYFETGIRRGELPVAVGVRGDVG